MIRIKKYLLLLLLLIPISFFSCEREFVSLNGSEGLKFSTDTLTFDTIFTSIGSATKNFRIYNPYNEDLLISSVELWGGEQSNFRLNINGQAEDRLENLKINAKDSLFIFVDVTIKPDDSSNPFVVNDSILFYSGEKVQKVNLIAYGQNVELLEKTTVKTSTFTADKPYLIYDFLIVDSMETLTIEPGAHLYFHDNARLVVFGSMQVNGTAEEPVSFLGDRLEDWYKDKPGQWGHIHFMPSSSKNSINHAIIKNGLMGVFADSVGTDIDAPPLTISNTVINHISKFGILTQNSKVNVSNTVIGNCGIHSVALTLGGTYNFYHCTVANYFPSWMYRSTPALFLNNHFNDDSNNEIINPLIEANFYNSIIYGDKFQEIGFDFKESDKFENKGVNYKFVSCLIKAGDISLSDNTKYVSVWAANKEQKPNFVDVEKFNYQLDTLSFCKDIGNIEIGNNFPNDILNNNRTDDNGPDLGAYERIEKE